MIDTLVEFAIRNSGKDFDGFDRQRWHDLLRLHDIIVIKEQDEITGFGVYDNGENSVFFYCIIKKIGVPAIKAISVMLKVIENCLPQKTITWIDEKRGRIIEWGQ